MPPEETIQEKNEQATQQDKTEGQQLASAVQNAASAINQRDQGAPVIEPEQVRSTQQVNIPQVPDGGLADETIAQADQQMTPTEIAEQAEQEQRQRTQSVRDEVQSLINRAAGRGERQTEIEENLGIDEQQDKLSTVNEEIAALQEAHRKRMRELGAGPGATAEQVNDLQRQEKTRHAARLADKQIIKSAIQGNIDRIQSNAKRKVDLEFEPIEQQLEFQKQFLEQNQELLSDAQQTRLRTAINTSQKRMTRQREKAEELQNTKTQLITNASQQNAPKYVLDQIQDATSREDAIQAAGDFGVSVDTQLERQQARADLRASEADLRATEADIAATRAGTALDLQELQNQLGQDGTQTGKVDPSQVIGSLPSAGERDLVTGAIGVAQQGARLLSLLEGEDGVSTGPIEATYFRGVDFPLGLGGIPGRESIPGSSEKTQQFEAAATQFMADFIKSISGAQVSDEERKRLMQTLPDLSKQEDVNATNIREVIKNLNDRVQAVTGTPIDQFEGVPEGILNENGTQQSNQTVTIGNEEFTVGETVTNDAGQTGVVNADGTITLTD